MLLSSPAYFTFFACVFFAYWLAIRYRLAGLAVILFANYFFYARWDLLYLILVPAASTVDYFVGLGLARFQRTGVRRTLVAVSVFVNIGLVASLKYLPLANSAWTWTLPLGLSFYAFQSLTYTLDIYRRDAKPTASYLAYLCSSSFFPTTLAGPITRIPTLLLQFEKTGRLLTGEDGGRALFLIGMGLMKKFLIADFLAENLVNRVFDLPKLYSSTEVLFGVYGYAFQLYYDFSGYTDIALGSALLLGIKLPINFNRPYAAENVADFWRRWHISLSNWLRDYLYFSLPGLRSRWKIFTYTNLIITMAIGGLWHGASWTFLIWGALHGIGLAVVRGWQTLRGKRKPSQAWDLRLWRQVLTFHFVAFTWIFFRAGSMQNAFDILGQIGAHTVSVANISSPFLLILAIAVLAHYVPKGWYDFSVRIYIGCPSYVQATAMVLLIIAIQYLAATGAAPFIYTKF